MDGQRFCDERDQLSQLATFAAKFAFLFPVKCLVLQIPAQIAFSIGKLLQKFFHKIGC